MWAIAVGPWLIASQASAILGRVWATPMSGWERLWKLPLVALSAMAVAIIAALIAAVITPLAILLLLISLISLPIVSDLSRGLAQNLAGSFGDLLVLVRSPIRFAAMTERVRDDIARLDSQCDRVMVVAHSQGSAVAWQAIRRAAEQPEGSRPSVSLLVSFGQAMRKLKSLYRVHAQAGAVQFQFSVLALLSSAE